ncbi:uncharacterized protein LOC120642250 [Panicum virgatum]|uniref:Uncharacterized protein n=1 Tax=Panicum virgatum TaxID=38727 RepID=A0A8T0QI75_PANVG|nr:uncharacterized protein LOC120642250 [Panicum virgatum]KAG2572499.1 hypothetical protein PVAP13_7KG182300 [Panicum virgatum]
MAPDAGSSLPAVPFVAVLDAGGGGARAWSGNGGGAPSAAPAASVDVPALWSDEGRMKRELVAWARAVASMAVRESMHG